MLSCNEEEQNDRHIVSLMICIQSNFNALLQKTKARISELQEAKMQSQELDGLLQEFNDWADEALEKTLSATNAKLSSTFTTIQVIIVTWLKIQVSTGKLSAKPIVNEWR